MMARIESNPLRNSHYVVAGRTILQGQEGLVPLVEDYSGAMVGEGHHK
jgi:hypothetical protein